MTLSVGISAPRDMLGWELYDTGWVGIQSLEHGKRPPPVCPAELYILLAGKELVAFLPFLGRRGLQALAYNLDIEPHSSWMTGDKVQHQVLGSPRPPSDHPEARGLWGQETQGSASWEAARCQRKILDPRAQQSGCKPQPHHSLLM